jgi:hypothetical protein
MSGKGNGREERQAAAAQGRWTTVERSYYYYW